MVSWVWVTCCWCMTSYNPNNESIRVNYTCLGPTAISSPLSFPVWLESLSLPFPVSSSTTPPLPLPSSIIPSLVSPPLLPPFLLSVSSSSCLFSPLPLPLCLPLNPQPLPLSLCPSSQGLLVKLCLITMLAFNWNSIHKHTDWLTEYSLHVDTLHRACTCAREHTQKHAIWIHITCTYYTPSKLICSSYTNTHKRQYTPGLDTVEFVQVVLQPLSWCPFCRATAFWLQS